MSYQAPKIIVALDYADKEQALALASQLSPELCRLKVGKELFVAAGPQLVEDLISKGFDVFLDLKFHDIPNTVAKACKAAVNLGVWMLNVHASGGSEMLQAAREAVASDQALLIAVTVLTSMHQMDLTEQGVQRNLNQQVLALAALSKQAGLDGVVCSAHEAPELKQECGEGFCLVTPGIRPASASNDDQKRIMTPAAALSAGSDYLVIGRPITQAENPAGSLQAILHSIAP